jgi:geranylgeranyl diphosphate synthase type I
MRFPEKVEKRGELVLPVIKSQIDEALTKVEYRDAEIESMYEYATSGDSLFRPGLLILSCEAVGGSYKDAIDVAACLELISRFTFLHDDLIDKDKKRYGKESFWVKYSPEFAIIMGDFLLSQAFELLNKQSSNPRVLSQCNTLVTDLYTRLCISELKDQLYRGRFDLNEKQYLELANLRTGPILEEGMKIGAILGSGSSLEIRTLGKYGKNLGMGLILLNDLEAWFGSRQASKERGSDIKEKKTNLALIHALSTSSKDECSKLKSLLNREKIDPKTRELIISTLQKAGSFEHNKSMATSYFLEAKKSMEGIRDSPSKHALLELIASFSD